MAMPAREMFLHLACVLPSRGVALAGALLFSTGHAAHAVCGGTLFARGAAGVGVQGWHAVRRLRDDRDKYVILHAARSETSSNSWKLRVINDASFSACVVDTRSNTS